MKHKPLVPVWLLTLLLSGCTVTDVFVSAPTALREEYRDDNTYLYSYGLSEKPVRPTVHAETCSHQVGGGYIIDAETHTYVCRRCRTVLRESEAHSEVYTRMLRKWDGYYAYASQCEVCAREKLNLLENGQFEILVRTTPLPEDTSQGGDVP